MTSHPHGCVIWNKSHIYPRRWWTVAPSRVRELKLSVENKKGPDLSRTLTGAWIETSDINREITKESRTLTGAWIETFMQKVMNRRKRSHPHGCVNWNLLMHYWLLMENVAPSRVRELKHCGCNFFKVCESRTLTGAWIETMDSIRHEIGHTSHPHGCVNWNLKIINTLYLISVSHPHGCVNWNQFIYNRRIFVLVAPSRVRELKPIDARISIVAISRTLPGAWIETAW